MKTSVFLREYMGKIGIDISKEQSEKFSSYCELLLEYNAVMNLTAITDEKEICIKHFADSAVVLKYFDLKHKDVIDVGTGAGFPGLPLKILCPEMRLTLLDGLNKRVAFLEEVCRKLSLENVTCIHARAEEAAKDESMREKYDIALSRAVAPLNILCEYDMPFVKVGGKFLALKGKNAETEIKEAENAVSLLGGKLVKNIDIKLPDTDFERYITEIEKTSPTDTKYPRRAKKISTSPL